MCIAWKISSCQLGGIDKCLRLVSIGYKEKWFNHDGGGGTRKIHYLDYVNSEPQGHVRGGERDLSCVHCFLGVDEEVAMSREPIWNATSQVVVL